MHFNRCAIIGTPIFIPLSITFYLLIRGQTTIDKLCDKLDALMLEIRKEHS
ncbi:hypothetical protein [uncultured Anaerovibrio sp.]|uniref:hypothetical protein n=1 Tax=uncultured Anaerovibrio sp. TaxID=361586 RepID=UPI00262E46BB|nr:hypothetical protein [uncultured Anaerovibrio sp.]